MQTREHAIDHVIMCEVVVSLPWTSAFCVPPYAVVLCERSVPCNLDPQRQSSPGAESSHACGSLWVKDNPRVRALALQVGIKLQPSYRCEAAENLHARRKPDTAKNQRQAHVSARACSRETPLMMAMRQSAGQEGGCIASQLQKCRLRGCSRRFIGRYIPGSGAERAATY